VEQTEKSDRSGPEWRRAEVFINLEAQRCEGEGDQEVLQWIETLGQTSSAHRAAQRTLHEILYLWGSLPDMPLAYYVTATALKLTHARVLAERCVNAERCLLCGAEVKANEEHCDSTCPRRQFVRHCV
jgi:hypothetical protein